MTDKKTIKFRHELKYSINSCEDLILTSRLRKLFLHDKYADSHGVYRVSSLYFDTPTDRALREKTDGVNRREKFRIRYYNGDPSFIRLEKKIKINGLCAKRSARLTEEQTRRILAGDFAFLRDSGDGLHLEFYSKVQGQLLRPRTVVTYDREAFLYEPGNVRITLDRNVRSGLWSTDFLTSELLHIPVNDTLTVLEVKYDEFLPDLVRTTVQIGRHSSAYSKYAACRRYD